MALRRRNTEGESLELMLDTICNVFGGIMFIALLLALFTSTQTEWLDDASPEADAAVSRAARLAEAESLQHRIVGYERSIEWLSTQTDDLSNDREEQAESILDNIDARVRDAQQQREQLKQWLEDHAAMMQAQEEQLQARLEQERDTIDALERELTQLQEAHAVDARLPQARRTTRQQLLVMVSNGRLYWIPLGQSGRMFNQFDGDIDLTQLGVGRWAVNVEAGGGEVVPEQIDEMQRFTVMTDRADPRRHFFDIYLRPDSVEAFRRLRDGLTEHGFRYQVHPLPARGTLRLGTTDDPLSTQ